MSLHPRISTPTQVERVQRPDGLSGILANAGWLVGDRVFRAAVSFVVGAWVARYLGPQQFGQFAFALAFIAFFQAAATLGLDSLAVRDIARRPESAPLVLGSVLRLRVFAGLLSWAAAVAIIALWDGSAFDRILMIAIVGAVPAFQAADTIDLWFQSQGQNRRTVQAKLAAVVAGSSAKVALVLLQAPLVWFAGAFLLDFLLVALALALAYRSYPTAGRWSFDWSVARRLLEEGWPFLVSAISIVAYMRIDQIMLTVLRGSRETGIYASALPLSQIWHLIPTTLAISVGPMLARRKLECERAYENALVWVFRGFGIASLAAAAATCLAAPFLVPLVYGPAFFDAVFVLQIHVFANLFVAMGVAQTLWVTNEGKSRILLIQTALGAVVSISLNLILIPQLGATGAAIAAVCAQASAAFLVNTLLAPRIFLMQMGIRPTALVPA